MKPSDNVNAAIEAHLMRLSARLDALESLVLALASRSGVDAAGAEKLLRKHQRERLGERLADLADRDSSAAAWSAKYLKAWERSEGQ